MAALKECLMNNMTRSSSILCVYCIKIVLLVEHELHREGGLMHPHRELHDAVTHVVLLSSSRLCSSNETILRGIIGHIHHTQEGRARHH